MDDLREKIAELASSGKIGLSKHDLDTAFVTAAYCLGRLERALCDEHVGEELRKMIEYVRALHSIVDTYIGK